MLVILPCFAFASELSARQLQQYCNEKENAMLGKKYDTEKANLCSGYLMGFFDSQIITDQIARQPQFCIPHNLPKIQNNLILNAWAKENEKIADTTTAAVALYSAYKNAFPCR